MQLTTFFILLFAWNCRAHFKELVHGNNRFTASIYKVLVKNSTDNILVSPLSVEIALALVQIGAQGDTASELQRALQLPTSKEAMMVAFQDLFKQFKEKHTYQLKTANKMYVAKNSTIKHVFSQLARLMFEGEIENVDFSHPVRAANTINKWVEGRTEHKIRNTVDPTTLNSATRMVIVNALYFKAKWMDAFNAHLTGKRKFHKMTGEVIEVDAMYVRRAMFGYYECTTTDVRFLKMDFEGGNVSMVIALPKKSQGLGMAEDMAESTFAPKIFRERRVNLMLPKFKFESTMYLKEALKKLGVSKAFSKDDADFSDIIEGKHGIMISEVVQKSFIDVNEKGVEVAAATEILMLTGASPVQEEVMDFIVDHPFMYYIKFDDIILFAGRITVPNY